MKVAIYMGQNLGDPVEARNIQNGNPGIGGTQYLMLLLANHLVTESYCDVTIFTSRSYITSFGGSKTHKWR